MSKKLVTTAQVAVIQDMANKKEISHHTFQQALDDGTFDRLLDDLKAEEECIRTHELSVTVVQNRPWKEALEAAGPDTPDNYNIRKIEECYQPKSDKTEDVEFVLLNFSENGSWDKALKWAISNGYEPSNPREVFAVAEKHDLIKILGINDWIHLVATTKCTFDGCHQSCFVDLDESDREVDLDWLDNFDIQYVWFLFRLSADKVDKS